MLILIEQNQLKECSLLLFSVRYSYKIMHLNSAF